MRVLETIAFSDWLAALRDIQARVRIAKRIARLRTGNAGDVKPVGAGVVEMRIHYGPGYRLYFIRRGDEVVVLLCGGDKRTQPADIKRAIALSKEV